MIHSIRCVALALLLSLLSKSMHAQATADGADQGHQHPEDIVDQLYATRGHELLWYCDACAAKRSAMEHILAGAAAFGLSPSHYGRLSLDLSDTASASRDDADRSMSRAAVSFCRDLSQGRDMARWISYNGIAGSRSADRAIVEGIREAADSTAIMELIAALEPRDAQYRALKAALRQDTADDACQLQLKTSLNFYRWVRHYRLDSFIVINIPSATLRYFRSDTVALEMRAVVGTTENRTPRFAAYCNEVTLYPYWNMPRSILMKEWISSFRSKPDLLNFMSMEVIESRGKVVPASSIDWKTIGNSSFPYRIREKPGCSNPMGVVKFSLNSPYDVYLHDTNFKGAFLSKNRFYSHGCIRVEEPIALADAILVDKVDAAFLKACFKDQKPQIIGLKHPVPVFIVYMCAEADETGIVRYYNDVYKLLRSQQ